jgi:hypothetical protein
MQCCRPSAVVLLQAQPGGQGATAEQAIAQLPLLRQDWPALQIGQQAALGMHAPLQHCCPAPQEPQEPPQPSLPQALPAQFGLHLDRFFFLRFFLRLARASSPTKAGVSPQASAPRIAAKARRVRPPLSRLVSESK